MSFPALLKAATEAPAAHEAAVSRLEAARSEVEAASKDHDDKQQAALSADRALHVFLKERGTHFLQAKDGTITTYRHCEPGRGWVAEHPTAGTDPAPAAEEE